VSLGTLVVQADLALARGQAYAAALRALISSTALVSLVSLVLFLLTRSMISRHLSAAAAHFQSLKLATGPGERLPLLLLDKKPAGDELDLLAHAVNDMQENLARSYDQICVAEQEVRSLARFPEENPNPVLRVSAEGLLVLANPASKDFLEHLNCAPGFRLPREYEDIVHQTLASGKVQRFEASFGGRTYAFAAQPILPDGFVNIYGMDITRRVRAEEEIQRNVARLQCLVRVLQHTAGSVQEFLDYCLNEALALTESRFGYIYHYSEERREFVLNTWSSEVMRQCAVKTVPERYELDKTGLWGEVVRQGKPVVVNDFHAANPLKRGTPEGHVELLNFMSVPVLHEGRVVAVAGVANKAGPYGDGDVLQLTLLMDACWQMVVRMEAEQDVLRSLQEKEILLKEIHHRVKNNLQIISSLLFLQMEYVSDPADKILFAESQKRIQAMALVHEELYGVGGDLSSVNMRDYVPRLAERVASGANIPVRVECRVDEVRLPVTRSIPCGLLLNELVMNAVKHAFRPGQGLTQGHLRVTLARAGDRLLLTVEDNGPGLAPDFDITAVGTLGMTLILSLAAQLGGQVTAENASPGARFSLAFPLEGP